MASIEFCDEKDNSLTPLNDNTQLPDNVVRMTIWASFGGDYDCDDISTMLQNFPTKLQKVTIYDIYIFPPDYVALFALILNKTERLELSDSLRRNVVVCQAFQHHNIRELDLYQLLAISMDQARSIFEGIAYSTSLQKLHLGISFQEHELAIPLLVEALQQNKSLKHLSLNLPTLQGHGFFSNVIRAAVIDMKQLKSLSIGDPRRIVQLPIGGDLMDTLCRRPDCALEQLTMQGIEPLLVRESSISGGCDLRQQRTKNASVNELRMMGITLDCSRIMDTVGALFQSLVSLELVDTNISNLSPLTPLLIGDKSNNNKNNLTLQRLSLSGGHQIANQDLLEFVAKLPNMTCLRHLTITMDTDSFDANKNKDQQTDNAWQAALANSLWRNKSLEQVNVGNVLCSEYDMPLHINRAWRKSNNSEQQQLPTNLWPQVLQRAMRVLYYRGNDAWKKPTLESPRKDVTYWLLKELIVPQSCC
ncbi:MAG: hypothetical protein SGBAC_000710 [Bacillariaceae sp.]